MGFRPPSAGSGQATIVNAGNLGAAYTLDLAGGKDVWLTGTLNANTAITVTGLTAAAKFRLLLTQDATGGRTVTISDGVSSAAPAVASAPGAVSVIEAISPDGTDIDIVGTTGGVATSVDVDAATAQLDRALLGYDAATSKFKGRDPGFLNAKWFGAKGDGRVVTDAATTSGQRTVTSATANFTQADQGKLITVNNPNAAATFASVIESVTNATTVVTAAGSPAATFTSTGAGMAVSSDDGTALRAWLTAVGPGGGGFLPRGIYGTSLSLSVPGDANIVGVGHDYGLVQNPAGAGSVLLLMATVGGGNPFVGVGTDGVSFGTNISGSSIEHLSVDAQNLAADAARTVTRRARIAFCQVWRGSTNAVNLAGQNSRLWNSLAGQQNNGDVVLVASDDAKVVNNEIRQGGGNQVHVLNCSNWLVTGNHTYAGFNGTISSANPGNNVLIESSGGANVYNGTVSNNSFDGTYGAHVYVKVGASTTRMGPFQVTDNTFFQISGFPDATFPFMEINVASGATSRGVNVKGNTGHMAVGASQNYTALVTKSGAGTVTHCSVTDNTALNCAAVAVGFRPDGGYSGNVIAKPASVAVSLSDARGSTTISGTGSSQTVNIAHGLAAAPTSATVTPSTPVAVGVTYDATNVIVTGTFPSGSNNVVLNWAAAL